jgi:acetolactate synthase regulatory subunit
VAGFRCIVLTSAEALEERLSWFGRAYVLDLHAVPEGDVTLDLLRRRRGRRVARYRSSTEAAAKSWLPSMMTVSSDSAITALFRCVRTMSQVPFSSSVV